VSAAEYLQRSNLKVEGVVQPLHVYLLTPISLALIPTTLHIYILWNFTIPGACALEARPL
jgi:hypothetical protein